MKIKRIILLTVVIMIAITSLSIASAGWFDANQNDAKQIPTELLYRVSPDNSSVEFQIYYNDSQSKADQTEGIVYYNITDEDGNVISGNTTVDIRSHDDKVDLPGSDKKYVISAYFPGKDKYAPSPLKNFTVIVPGSSSGSSSSGSSSSSSSSGENPFEDFHTDPSSSIDSLAQHSFS